MKILYISTSFPNPSQGDTIYSDLAEALHKNNHQLTVVVAEQSKNIAKSAITKERGFDVLRIPVGNFYDVGLLEKGITFLKMSPILKRGIAQHFKNQTFDFVLFSSPPTTLAKLVSWIKKKYHCKSYLMLKDIFPQNALDLRIFSKFHPVYHYFKYVEKKMYKHSDYIGCMSNKNIEYLLKHYQYLNPDKVHLFPNTKKVKTVDLNAEKIGLAIRESNHIPFDSSVFLLGGNIGKPQYVDLLIDAMVHFKDNVKVFFLIVGRGTERNRLKETISKYNIKNVLMIDNLPREDYEKYIFAADFGLITLDPRFTIPNFPSRALSYMEFGIPILAATDKESDFKDFIEINHLGKWVWSGDSNNFLIAIEEMAANKSSYKSSNKGRLLLENELNVNESVILLEKIFSIN